MDPNAIREQLNWTLENTDLGFLNSSKYEGKVRDNYTFDGKRLLVTTDRLSAFDRIITTIPFKGQLLSQLAAFWFNKTLHIVGNHYIDAPDPNAILAVECTPIAVEMVVRGYLTGSTSTSIWHSYSKGERNIYGLDFPDGLNKNDSLPNAIITPTTKAQQGQHDERTTGEQLVKQGIISSNDWEFLSRKSLELFKFGVEFCDKLGVILVDTKYEFGRTPAGEIVLIDEIHTPDSSRFWIKSTYESRKQSGEEPENINKEHLRLWLANQGYTGDGEMPVITDEIRIETAQKYIEAYELITGAKFQPILGDTNTRITQNIKKYFNL